METPVKENPEKPIRINAGLTAFLGVAVLIIAVVHQAGDRNFDFGVFYYGARMVWDGAATRLYDIDAQHAFQLRFGRPPDLVFYYPPFALLPFLPLVRFPIGAAFVIWTAGSVVLLTIAVRWLCVRMGLLYGHWPILLSLAFMPVASSLGHGQLSIATLAAYVWCYALWSDGRRFAGGMALALAAFKFQLVTGFVFILLLRRKWRELAGFSVVCVSLALLSLLMVGLPMLLKYPAFLARQSRPGPGVDPTRMANLRGLVAFVAGNSHIVVVAALSLVVVVWASLLWKDLNTGFCAAILASMLVSYHFNPQDLSLLVIPLFLTAKKWAPSDAKFVVPAALVLPLAAGLAGGGYFALLAIPCEIFFLVKLTPSALSAGKRIPSSH